MHIFIILIRSNMHDTQGIRASALSNAARTGHPIQENTHSMPLSFIEESQEAPEIGRQLPTPDGTPQPDGQANIPLISDSLFDNPEEIPYSDDSVPNRSYTAASGNPMLTIVDRNGVFELEVVYCICSDVDSREEELLKCRLFPATFKSIKTLFTFSVLDDFLNDNLECKTTAQQYYSKLQSTTSKMFPNLVPVCNMFFFLCIAITNGDAQNLYKQLLRSSRQWRDLKNRMEQGLGHQSENTPDGSMAIFCPACPQPGVNLPHDWSTRYKPYVITPDSDIASGSHVSGHKK
jgi:CxC2 like cysteine cluster associated with KDZ transposases